METKFTKGEWKYDVLHRGSTKSSVIRVLIPNGTILITGYIGEDDCTCADCCRVEEHANAKLIAAAPELLEALTNLMGRLSRYGYTKDSILFTKNEFLLAENAIKKATE